MASTRDLTTGKPLKLILSFYFPTMFGFLFQQFYNLADSAIVGHTLGAEKLGAVGSTLSLSYLVLGFCMGCCSGFAIPMAQNFGARNEKALRKCLYHAIRICAVLSVFFTVITTLMCTTLLRWMRTPAEIIEDADIYLRICYLGIPATILYNMCCCILRALGDSRTPVYFLIMASLVNVVLDYLMILGFQMGVAGAAAATVVSQLLSGIGCLITLIRKFPILRGEPDEKKLEMDVVGRLIRIGFPMGFQFSITTIGALVLQVAVNGLGTFAVSSLTVGGRVNGIFNCAYDALGSTISNYSGQNIGAGRPDRVSQGVRASLMIGLVYTAAVTLFVWLFSPTVVGLFVDASTSPQVMEMGSYMLRVNCSFYVVLLLLFIMRMTIQGMGYTRDAMFAGLFETAARILVSAILIPAFGFSGAAFAHPAAWILACAFLCPCYFSRIRKEKRRFGRNGSVPQV